MVEHWSITSDPKILDFLNTYSALTDDQIRRFVVTAAHCFCRGEYPIDCQTRMVGDGVMHAMSEANRSEHGPSMTKVSPPAWSMDSLRSATGTMTNHNSSMSHGGTRMKVHWFMSPDIPRPL